MPQTEKKLVRRKKASIRLAEDLRVRLEAEIFSSTLAPGDRLDETKLAQRFGVSRTPVREALMQLASSGLVEMRPRHGAVVAAITVQSLLQMFEVMAELEAMCARLAARRATPDERAAIKAAHEACKRAADDEDPNAYYEVNRVFHEKLYAGAHNGYLEDSTRNLRNRLSSYRRFQLRRPGRIARSQAEHGAVVEAILAGDPEAAADAMRAHITVQSDVFTDLISTLPPRYLQAAGQ